MNDKPQTALITGASGGIGYELAELFARNRYNLVLVARSGARLSQFADELQRHYAISARAITLDLTWPQAPQSLFEQLQLSSLHVDILVNNAGYGVAGEFARLPLEEDLGMMRLNLVALTVLTKLFLKPMLARGAGRILNVASTAGFQPGPLMAVYYATKAYVISFSEALADELKGTGVTMHLPLPRGHRYRFPEASWYAELHPLPKAAPHGRQSRCSRWLPRPDGR
jgi:short-subunit dehydrogenase